MKDLKTQVIKAIRAHNPAAATLAAKRMQAENKDLNEVKHMAYWWRKEIIVIPGSMQVRSSLCDELPQSEWLHLFKRDVARYVATTWYRYMNSK